MNIKFHKSIKGRLFIFVIALFAVGIGAMAVINVTVHNKTLANEISKRSQLIEVSHRQALKISALKLLNQIATSALDFKNLQIEDRHFSYYLVVKNGKTVFHSQRENVSTLPTEDLAWLKSKDLSTPVEDGYYFKNNQEELMAFNMPLHLESKPWGNFLVVFNVDGMKAAQNELVMSLNDQTSQNLLKALSFYGGIFVVALLLILQFSRRLTQSLEQLKQW